MLRRPDVPGPLWCLPDADAVASAAAHFLVRRLGRAVATRGVAHCMLSGGQTPRPTYALLARADLPWESVHVWFADERAVPPDHADSNYGMAAGLLADVFERATVHRMSADAEDRDWAAEAYASVLPEVMDVLLLGIGADGHTASLFPGSPAMAETRRVVAVPGPEGGLPRLTITPPVIRAARAPIVLATGADKAPAVAAALAGAWDPARVPAQAALHGTWILDEAARGQSAAEGGSP